MECRPHRQQPAVMAMYYTNLQLWFSNDFEATEGPATAHDQGCEYHPSWSTYKNHSAAEAAE